MVLIGLSKVKKQKQPQPSQLISYEINIVFYSQIEMIFNKILSQTKKNVN